MRLNSRFHELIILSPLLIAYVLQGGKTALTFLPVFLAIGSVLIYQHQVVKPRPVPRMLLWTFGGLLLWLWIPLIGKAPLEPHLFIYARIFVYVLAGYIAFQESSKSIDEKLKFILITLGIIETIFVLFGAIRGHQPQTSGILKVSLHSGILLPIAYALLLTKIKFSMKAPPRNWLYTGLAILIVIGLVYIRSRSGLLSIGVITFYLAPIKKKWILVLGIALLSLLGIIYGKTILMKLEIDSLGWKMSLGRFTIWKSAFEAIISKPILGYGLGNFEAAYRVFQYPSLTVIRFGNSTIFAHNGLLQIATEAGIPALILMLSGIFALLKNNYKNIIKKKSFVSILIVFLITSLFNYSLFLPFNGLIFAIILGRIASTTPKKKISLNISQRPLIPVGLLGVLSIFLFLYAISEYYFVNKKYERSIAILPIRSEVYYQQGLQKLTEGKDPIPDIRNAIVWNPQNSFYWQRLALILIDTKFKEKEMIETIDYCFRMAQILAPHHAPFFLQEGFYRLSRKEYKEAERLFVFTSQLEPASPMPHIGMAMIFKMNGRFEDEKMARTTAQRLIENKNKLENGPKNRQAYRHIFSSPYAKSLFPQDPIDY